MKDMPEQAEQGGGSPVKLSLIIPMYYSEDYVEPLLQNLCTQIGPDAEILCVVDGSPDKTRELVEARAARDSRIRVLTQEHRGAGAARNLGLDNARGEYLMFPDADDIYAPDYVPRLLEAVDLHGADMAVCQIRLQDLLYHTGFRYHGYWGILRLKDRKVSPASITGLINIVNSFPQNKIWRRDFVQQNHLRFSETMSLNDMFFSRTSLLSASSIVFVKEHLLTYQKHHNPRSISTTRWKNPTDMVRVYRQFYDWLKANGKWEKHSRDFYAGWSFALRYYARYCKGETFVRSVVRELVEEEPWKHMGDAELRRSAGLFTAPTRRDLAQYRARLGEADLSPEMEAALQTRCRHAEQEIYNYSEILRILREEYGRRLEGKDDMIHFRKAKYRRAGFIRTCKGISKEIQKRMVK